MNDVKKGFLVHAADSCRGGVIKMTDLGSGEGFHRACMSPLADVRVERKNLT